MPRILLLLTVLLAEGLGAVEYIYPNQVELRKMGSLIRIVNQRNNQELSLSARNVVAVIPADRDDNNAYTVILTKGAVVKLQQRTNPADQVVAVLSAMGFDYIPAVADRDARTPDTYLVNARNIDLIDRSRTDSERSDTTVHFNAEVGGSPGRFSINQSAAAYKAFIERVEALRY